MVFLQKFHIVLQTRNPVLEGCRLRKLLIRNKLAFFSTLRDVESIYNDGCEIRRFPKKTGHDFLPMVLYVVGECFCYDIQVGTVLFTKADLMRKCWTESDKALLRARLIMQDVLPDPRCIDFSKPSAISVTLDYIFACFQIIGTSTYGKLQHLMNLALADAVGGYLRAYVMPFTRKSYYAGLVTYEDACRVFKLYDEILEYLKTNGAGWAEPQKVVFKNLRVPPLEIVSGNPAACNILYTIEKKGKLHCINAKCSPKTSYLPDLQVTDAPRQTTTGDFNFFTEKFQFTTPFALPEKTVESSSKTFLITTTERNASVNFRKLFPPEENSSEKPHKRLGELHIDNETMEEFSKEERARRNVRCDLCERTNSRKMVKAPKRIIIPLPILDDACEPHTVAVPFRKKPLRSLWKRNSAFVLEHYYVAVLQCLIGKDSTRADIKNFNAQFHNWLTCQVYPRLEDEKWYPAFGGILRVKETMKRFGVEAKVNEPMAHDIAFLFRKGFGFEYPEDEEKSASKDKIRDVGTKDYYEQYKVRRFYALAILTAAAVWFIVFCVCAIFCSVLRSKHSDLSVTVRSRTSLGPPDACTEVSKPCAPEKKGVSFQFLVRFFRNSESGKNLNNSPENKKLLNQGNQRKVLEKNESRESILLKPNKEKKLRGSKNDVVVNVLQQEKPWAFSEGLYVPTLTCDKVGIVKTPESAVANRRRLQPRGVPQVDSSKILQTLWKNPFLSSANTTNKGSDKKKSTWFRLSSKKKSETSTPGSYNKTTTQTKTSTDVRTSPYTCSTVNSPTSTSNCTSYTPVDEKCSSATMEFLEKVIFKHKSTKRHFKEKSSTKSDFYDDSCSSENDY